MAQKNKQNEEGGSVEDVALPKSLAGGNHSPVILQGLIGIACWMSFGLLLEGLIAFRVTDYLSNAITRELFRLAHAHGTLLSLALVVVGLCIRASVIDPPSAARLALQIGTVVMPVGFLLGGIGNYESDPNPTVFMAPIGGLMVIFGIVASAFSFKKN